MFSKVFFAWIFWLAGVGPVASQDCFINVTLTLNRSMAEIDINTTTPFCFIVPVTPIAVCSLNGAAVTSSPPAVVFNEPNVMVNDWTAVNLDNRNPNQLQCDAGVPAVQETYYANFYSLTPEALELFGNESFYNEGATVSVVCRNRNQRPGFRGTEMWTNFTGGVAEGGNTLVLTAIRELAGQYTCSVPTVPEIIPFVFDMVVHYAPEITTMSKSEDMINVGEALTLDCSFVGFPTPNITWMLNDSFVFLAESGVSVNTSQSGSGSISRLTFINVTVASTWGNYSCIVSNVAGNSSRNFEILVAYAPDLTTMSRSEDMVNVGETLTLDCSFVGFPTPNITWMLNNSVAFLAESGVSVDTTQAGSGSISTLTFTNVTPATARGNYSCIVSNVVGNTSRNFAILVASSPEPAAMFNVMDTTNSSISFSWAEQFNGLANITGARLEYTVVGSGNAPLGVEVGRLSGMIAGLTDFTNYSVSLFLRNRLGLSDPVSLFQRTDTSFPLEIMDTLTEIFLLENESFALECNYVGFPAPSITWTFNDSIVSNDSSGISIVNFKSKVSGSSRFMWSTESSNNFEGNYSCIFINAIQSANTIFTVKKTTIQQLRIFPNDSTYFEGDSVIFHCENYNRAQQYIGDGVWTNSNGTVLGKRNLEFTATRELAGVYTCSLPMTPVDISAAYEIIIYYPPAVISSSPSETIAELGASFSLDCSYEGFPSPLVVWTMNDVVVTNESSRDITIVNIVNSSLSNSSRLSRTITTSSQSGPGKYSCILVNSAGATIKTFHVYLKKTITVATDPPTPSSIPLHVVVIVGCCIFLVILGSSVVVCVLQILLHKLLKKRQEMCTTRESNEIQSTNEAMYEEVQLKRKEETMALSSNACYYSVVDLHH